MPRAALSNEVVVEVAEQHYVLGRTLGQIADRFGINYSTLSESLKRIGKQLEPGLEKLKADYRASFVRHADACGLADGRGGRLQLVFWLKRGEAGICSEKPEVRVCQRKSSASNNCKEWWWLTAMADITEFRVKFSIATLICCGR